MEPNETPLITLTTDFGASGVYVPQMKGVLLHLCPSVRILDLSHDLPPQDIRHAAWFVREVLPWFAPGTIHIVVVDPGVGTARAALLVEWRNRWLLCPDNGLWTWLPEANTAQVRVVNQPQWWRSPPSSTFHGRDIFAPVAAHLANGTPAPAFGPCVDRWVTLPWSQPMRHGSQWHGEVVMVDHFGNLITNVSVHDCPNVAEVRLEAHPDRPIPWQSTYGAAAPGSIIALASSSGWIEIAEVQGHAAQRLGVRMGDRLVVHTG